MIGCGAVTVPPTDRTSDMCNNCLDTSCNCPTPQSGLSHCACSISYHKHCAACGHDPVRTMAPDDAQATESEGN